MNDATEILENYPRIHEPVQWLWTTSYYDGPEEGAIAINGHSYWAKVCDENESFTGWFRRYLVIDLDCDQWDYENYVHALFQRHVGTHWNYTNGQPPLTIADLVKPAREHHLFYDVYAKLPPRDYSKNTVVGWFER